MARLGGDEFGVILSDVDDPEEVLRRLRDVIENEVEVSGLPLSTESSIGYVVVPDDGTDVDELLQRADVAMYVAKAQHAGVVRYDAAQDHYDAGNLGLIAELRQAIDNDELVLHYQPKVTFRTGKSMPWRLWSAGNIPPTGLLYPDRFIPLAEQTDLIEKLTHWVLGQALSDVQLGTDFAHVAMSVNVSARNICPPVSPPRSSTPSSDTASPPTGSSSRSPRRPCSPTRPGPPTSGRAAPLGISVSIDDFGIGQTSLSFLSSLPVHELKIDKGFVTDMMSDAGHAAIVRSIIDLGHNLICGWWPREWRPRTSPTSSAGPAATWLRAFSSPGPCPSAICGPG